MHGRRAFLTGAAALAGLIAVRDAAGAEHHLTPADARAKAMTYRVLAPAEVATLEVLAETLVPGATIGGIAQFIDAHLAVLPADSLLMLRYLDVAPPWDGFYRSGLAALDAATQARHGSRFAALDADRRLALAREISAAPPAGWQGPPSPLFVFAVRADAVDVVYGTVAGFERLGVPYLEHILPEASW